MPGGGIPRPITPGGIPGENVNKHYDIVFCIAKSFCECSKFSETLYIQWSEHYPFR